MSRYVVDASVAVKWYLPEIHSEAADRLLTGTHELLAPDLLYPEIGNILWKRVMKSELTDEKARTILRSLEAVPIQLIGSGVLAEVALLLACRTKRSFYDSLYLALAVSARCELVTADLKLYNALKDAALLKRRILWIEDMPAKG